MGEELAARKKQFTEYSSSKRKTKKKKKKHVVFKRLPEDEFSLRKKIFSENSNTLPVTRSNTNLQVLTHEELDMRRKSFNQENTNENQEFVSHAGDLDKEIIYTSADIKASDKIEEDMDFSNVKNFKGFSETEIIQKISAEEAEKQRLVSNFEGFTEEEIRRNKAIDQEIAKLDRAKVKRAKSVFNAKNSEEKKPRKKRRKTKMWVKKRVKSVFIDKDGKAAEGSEENKEDGKKRRR